MFVKFIFKWESSPLSFISSFVFLDFILRDNWNQYEFYKLSYKEFHI